jgi:hypothetical protein
MKAALRPHGTLVVLDLCRSGSLAGRLVLNAFALPASLLLRLWHERRLLRSAEERRAWREHGHSDRYLSINEVRVMCRRLLPASRVRRHLLWRYSLVWRKS